MMETLGMKESETDPNTKEYIGDFNDFLKHVKMAKASTLKKGKEWTLPEAKKNKLIRLSKSICQSLQVVIDKEESDKKKAEEKKLVEEQKRKFLQQRREVNMRLRKEQAEKKKKEAEEKDDSIGFWF